MTNKSKQLGFEVVTVVSGCVSLPPESTASGVADTALAVERAVTSLIRVPRAAEEMNGLVLVNRRLRGERRPPVAVGSGALTEAK